MWQAGGCSEVSLAFEVGEKVIYPNHGVGIVEAIQPRQTPDGEVRGYDLRIKSNASRVWIPVDGADDIGLRALIPLPEASAVLELLRTETVPVNMSWKNRFQENADRMRTGNLHEVARVLKGLTELGRRKSLSFREKKMQERARELIVAELAEVRGEPPAAVEASVEGALTAAGDEAAALTSESGSHNVSDSNGASSGQPGRGKDSAGRDS